MRRIKVNPKLKKNKISFSESGISLEEITVENAEKIHRLLKREAASRRKMKAKKMRTAAVQKTHGR